MGENGILMYLNLIFIESMFSQNALDVEPETEMIQILQSEAAQDFETQKQKSSFRFTGEQVKFLTYMLDKHGNDFRVCKL